MAAFRSALFLVIFYTIGAVLIAIAMLGALFGVEGVIWGSRNWALWHKWCARVILGIRAEVDGNLDQGQALYILKHESMYEAVQTLALFKRPIVVMKRELFSIPGWGFAARKHGSIPVDREGGASTMRMMIEAARRAKASGRPIILFPEGTRVPHGERPELKAGMAGLYKILGLPVIPVAIDSGRVWPKGFVKRPGVVHLKVCDPIPAGLPREEIEARVHTAINSLND